MTMCRSTAIDRVVTRWLTGSLMRLLVLLVVVLAQAGCHTRRIPMQRLPTPPDGYFQQFRNTDPGHFDLLRLDPPGRYRIHRLQSPMSYGYTVVGAFKAVGGRVYFTPDKGGENRKPWTVQVFDVEETDEGVVLRPSASNAAPYDVDFTWGPLHPRRRPDRK